MLDLTATDNQILIRRITALAAAERTNQAEILQYLSEIDERRLVVDLGIAGGEPSPKAIYVDRGTAKPSPVVSPP